MGTVDENAWLMIDRLLHNHITVAHQLLTGCVQQSPTSVQQMTIYNELIEFMHAELFAVL